MKNFRGLAPGKTGDEEAGGRGRAKKGHNGEDDDHNNRRDDGEEGGDTAGHRRGKRYAPHAEGEDSDVSDDDADSDTDSVDSVAQRKNHKTQQDTDDDEDSEEDVDNESDNDSDIIGDQDEKVKRRLNKSHRMVVDEMSVGSLDTRDEEEIDRLVNDFKEFDETAGLDNDSDEDETDNKKKNKNKNKAKKASSSSSSSRKSLAGNNNNSQRMVEFNAQEHWIEVTLFLPVTSRRILLAQLAEKAATNTTIRATKNIARAYVERDESRKTAEHYLVGTEGVNFPAIWALPETLVDHNAVQSNDVWQILCHYGVEAARASIVHEIQSVFAVYGIDVNARHLSLIADFMTRSGGYNAMNRIGMLQCASPFLQMSFETTCTFLTRAVQEGLVDNQQSPSSRIVLGEAPRAGTGCFELLAPLTTKK